MTIVYVNVKGSPLNKDEFDGNFADLDTRVTALETTPPTPISIDHFVVEGTLLTIYLSDGTHQGPFVLPSAQWRWTGEWDEGITYLPGDIFTESGNVYFVRVQHVSVAPFDAATFGVDGFVYQLILSKSAQPYDIGLYFGDLIGSGEDLLSQFVAPRAITMPAMFEGAQGFLRTACSGTSIILPIYHTVGLLGLPTIVGTLSFVPGDQLTADGGQFGTFATSDPDNGVLLAATDRLSIGQPYEDDPAAKGLSVSFTTLVISE